MSATHVGPSVHGMCSIRKATADDLYEVRACARAAYAHYVERIGREPAPMVADFGASIARGELDVIEVEGTLAGYVVFYPQDDHLHLENVAVDPDFQGQGIGYRLIEYVERRAGELGYDRIELYTNAKMTENLALYPKLGFRQFDRRLEDGFDRVYFFKQV